MQAPTKEGTPAPITPAHLAGMVSVVIPAFNAAAWIRETLDSILAQTYGPIEIVVVDDGSTDETATVIGEYAPRVRLVGQPNSGGCSSPRNHGLRAATGAFVTFFDADDVMVPDKIERQVAFLQAHPDVALVTSDYQPFDEHGPHARTHFAGCPRLQAALGSPRFDGTLAPEQATGILAHENYSIAGSPLYRRALFDAIEAFDEGLLASEDFDLAYRAARQGPTGVLTHVGFLRRLHADNMSRQTTKILRYKLKSRAKLLAGETRQPQRKLLTQAVATYHLDLAEQLGRDRGPWRDVVSHVTAAVRLGGMGPVRALKALVRPVANALGVARSPRS